VIFDVQSFLLTPTHQPGSIFSINWDVLKRVIIILPFTIAFLWSTKISKTAFLIGISLILAIAMFAVIDTSLFGLIAPYYCGWYNGWAGRPSGLLLYWRHHTSCFCVISYSKSLEEKTWSNLELFSLVLFIPSIITAVSGSAFSALGMLVVLHASIPSVAAMHVLFCPWKI